MKLLVIIASQSNAVGDGVPDIPISAVDRVYIVSELTLLYCAVVVNCFRFNEAFSRHPLELHRHRSARSAG